MDPAARAAGDSAGADRLRSASCAALSSVCNVEICTTSFDLSKTWAYPSTRCARCSSKRRRRKVWTLRRSPRSSKIGLIGTRAGGTERCLTTLPTLHDSTTLRVWCAGACERLDSLGAETSPSLLWGLFESAPVGLSYRSTWAFSAAHPGRGGLRRGDHRSARPSRQIVRFRARLDRFGNGRMCRRRYRRARNRCAAGGDSRR